MALSMEFAVSLVTSILYLTVEKEGLPLESLAKLADTQKIEETLHLQTTWTFQPLVPTEVPVGILKIQSVKRIRLFLAFPLLLSFWGLTPNKPSTILLVPKIYKTPILYL